MKKTKQLSLFDSISEDLRDGKYERNRKTIPLSYGGKLTRRKHRRPLSSQKLIHLVWKSSKAIGKMSFLTEKNSKDISDLLSEKLKLYGVEMKDFVNAGDHLHLAVCYHDRKTFQNFLRVAPALIARKVQGAEKGRAKGKFWDDVSHTRVLQSRFEQLMLKEYFEANRVEIRNGRAARIDFWNEALDRMKRMKKESGDI